MEEDIRHFFGKKIECGIRFDSGGRIRSHTGLETPIEAAEPSLRAFADTYLSRDDCIAAGLDLNGVHFEVHRHHPPLVYGRVKAEEVSEKGCGFAACRIEPQEEAKDSEIMVIVYKFPHLSAEMVPMLIRFCEKYIGYPEIWYEAEE